MATPSAAIITGSVANAVQIGPILQLHGVLTLIATAGAYLVFEEVREAKH